MRGSGGSRIRNPAVFPESPVTLRPGPAREGSSGRSLGDASHGSLRHHGSSGGRSPSHKDPTRRLAGAQGRQLSGSVARVDSHSTSARFVGHRYASASTARSSAGRQSGGSKASFGLGGGLPKLDTSGLGRLSAGGASSVAQVRYRALSALPDVEEARLHKATLRFRDRDVEAKYGQFRRGSLSDVLVWHLVGGCGIAVAVTVGDMLVFGRFEVLVVAAIALMVLWAGSVCLAVSSPRWFSAVNTGFCAALMMVMCAQPFADDGDLAGPYSGMFVTESARQLLPWAPLIPVVVGLGWKSTVVSSSVWLVSVACAALWWWPLDADEASVQLVCQSAGVTIVVLVAAYVLFVCLALCLPLCSYVVASQRAHPVCSSRTRCCMGVYCCVMQVSVHTAASPSMVPATRVPRGTRTPCCPRPRPATAAGASGVHAAAGTSGGPPGVVSP